MDAHTTIAVVGRGAMGSATASRPGEDGHGVRGRNRSSPEAPREGKPCLPPPDPVRDHMPHSLERGRDDHDRSAIAVVAGARREGG